ncbi:MAG: hypothetical protein HY699_01010 [Deltaproteobacteria bacterium]|nr:hypothetical protein [Deltaproteobacteria bacterium]
MLATIAILLLWVGFAGSHIMLSSAALRPRLVARLGDQGFRGLYAAVAFAFFVPLVWTYFANKHAGPHLWLYAPGALLRWIIYLGMGSAFTLLVAGMMRPSPAGMRPGSSTPRGAARITRHPVFMAFALFGLMHLIPNGSTADIVFFGGFVVFTLIGARHQDQRKLAADAPGFREFYDRTPFLPFSGSETGQGIRELLPVPIAIAVVLTIVVRYFHASWFGG